MLKLYFSFSIAESLYLTPVAKSWAACFCKKCFFRSTIPNIGAAAIHIQPVNIIHVSLNASYLTFVLKIFMGFHYCDSMSSLFWFSIALPPSVAGPVIFPQISSFIHQFGGWMDFQPSQLLWYNNLVGIR